MTKLFPPKNIVLYADDDIDDLQLAQDAFLQYADNVKVVTVKDGVEALSYLKNLAEFDPIPCLIILDINMPRMSGKEALLSIRQMKRFESVPIILFTTSNQPHDKEFAHRHKAGFITKPIDARQMSVITDSFIEHCTEEVKKNIKDRHK
ncbi:MAG: response regulator [Chitinophagaceae bacterium]